MEEPLRQAGSAPLWANVTTVHPVGLAALLILGVAMLLVPRRFALLPMLVLACFVPSAQRVVVLSFDFDFLRLMVLLGWMRIVLRNEAAGFLFRPLDWVFVAWVAVGSAAYISLHATPSALVHRMGQGFDALGMYFLFRVLIRSWTDLLGLIKAIAVISLPVAAAFIVEQMTARNAFSVLGGVPAITDVRGGRLRCQGAFSHPILAGCFWASLLPLLAAAFFHRACSKWLMGGASAAALVIIAACASSTPVMAVLFGMLGAALFVVRGHMRLIRWGLLAALIALHMVMKAPVWHLMSRIDIVSGSTGWHRYLLVDQTIKHFGEWALMGTKTTSHWGHGMQDITNLYVYEAISGGVFSLALFVAIIAMAFGHVGRMWRAASGDRAALLLAWAIGVCLFVHCCNFMAVSYFGQISMMWFLTLALIGSLAPQRWPMAAARPAPQYVAGMRQLYRLNQSARRGPEIVGK